jgi:transcriptional regulator with XRE-family HTH domain
MYTENLVTRVRLERFKRNMTQAQACKELGMRVGTLSHIENDTGNPRKSTIKKLCNIYGMKAPLNE